MKGGKKTRITTMTIKLYSLMNQVVLTIWRRNGRICLGWLKFISSGLLDTEFFLFGDDFHIVVVVVVVVVILSYVVLLSLLFFCRKRIFLDRFRCGGTATTSSGFIFTRRCL